MAQGHAAQAIEQFRSEYATKGIIFDYTFHDARPFAIAAMYRDDHFTYIKSSAAEKFAVYELKDGKPELINFQLQSSTYVLPKVVDQGYLKIGKHRLNFHRATH